MSEKLEVRTQIYLDKAQHEALKKKAGEQSVSMAHLIREAVAAYLAQEQTDENDLDWDAYMNDPIWHIEEIVRDLGPTGLPNAAVNHDYYLYGMPKVEADDEPEP